MPNILQLKKRDGRTNKLKNVGTIEIKNQTTDTADLYFYGDIVSESWLSEWYEDDMCPKDVVKFLEQLEGVSTINVYINSGGGSVFAGLAIGHKLEQYPAQIIGHTDGIAASIAGVLLMFCDKVIMPSNAMFMMHKPLSSCVGNADAMRKEAEILDQCQKVILGVYMKKAKEGITEEIITEMINKETWLTGEEMQEYFDIELSESLQAAASCESDYFDKYSNTPKALRQVQTPETIDIDALAARLAEKLAGTFSEKNNGNLTPNQTQPETPEDNTELEKLKAAILEDLDLI